MLTTVFDRRSPVTGTGDLCREVVAAVVLAAGLASGCTYGPPQETATVEQVVRLGDSYEALVVVRYDTFRPPTGLSAFPAGGKRKYDRRGSATHWIDARSLESRLLFRMDATEEVWESHGAWIAGLVGDSVAYLRLTGCPRGGECYPGIDRTEVFRLTLNGAVTPADSIPPEATFPGTMSARAPGERAYVRFGTRGDSVTARFEEGVEQRALFVAGRDGILRPRDGGTTLPWQIHAQPESTMSAPSLDRRSFVRLFAAGGSAALLGHPDLAAPATPRPDAPSLKRRAGGDVDWAAVRAQFLMPPDLSVMNAANLCPSTMPVLEVLEAATRTLDREPVPSVRSEMLDSKETTRDLVAAFLRASPEEILLTRNTSEANNWISAGLDLGPGDEVVILSDNHPSNNQAWKARGERFGFTVREVQVVTPHPGFELYVDAFARAMTPRTRVIAFTHLINTSGDLLPARELCALARSRGVLSVVDGAQSFGLLDVDLSTLRPDFFTGSAHKWPCGPKETGVLYVSAEVHDRFHASVFSAYSGSRGLARTHEGLGQRDEPALRAFGRQIEFLMEIGQGEIETRSRALATALVEELSRLDGVRMWTPTEPELRAAVVTFQPGELEPSRVIAALEADGIVAASRGGGDRPGIRFSPHFYNSFEDVERGVEAIGRYLRRGI